MPTLEVKTESAEQVWKSPDGQRKIYKLVLDYKGKPVAAKTYSDAIATVGWSGTVESYEKEGRNGSETFVKQPPKEGGGYDRQGSSPTTPRSSYQPKDEKAIQAMWAIDKAKDVVTAVGIAAKDPLDDVESNIENWAQRLFLMVDRVKAVTEDVEITTEPESVEAEPSIEQLNAVFGDADEFTPEGE